MSNTQSQVFIVKIPSAIVNARTEEYALRIQLIAHVLMVSKDLDVKSISNAVEQIVLSLWCVPPITSAFAQTV